MIGESCVLSSPSCVCVCVRSTDSYQVRPHLLIAYDDQSFDEKRIFTHKYEALSVKVATRLWNSRGAKRCADERRAQRLSVKLCCNLWNVSLRNPGRVPSENI